MNVAWDSIPLLGSSNFFYYKPMVTKKEQKINDKKVEIFSLTHQRKIPRLISPNIRKVIPP